MLSAFAGPYKNADDYEFHCMKNKDGLRVFYPRTLKPQEVMEVLGCIVRLIPSELQESVCKNVIDSIQQKELIQDASIIGYF